MPTKAYKPDKYTKAERAEKALQYPEFIDREICKRSLYEFIQLFWSEYTSDKFVGNWHIEKVFCPELETIASKVANQEPHDYDLIINVPPGTTKTATCSIFFPVWAWTNWPWMRFITASYSAALSLESAEFSRDLVRSGRFKKLFPEIDIKQDKDTKSNFRIVRYGHSNWKALGSRYSTSVGGTLTGFHGHILLVDDPLDPMRALSDVEIAKANHWMTNTLSTRKTDKRFTRTILIQQRLHQKDPTGDAIDRTPESVRHICLPGEIRTRDEKGKCRLTPIELEGCYQDDLLDPVRMPWDVLKKMERKLGQYGYAGQVLQDPSPPGGGMFKVAKFQIIDPGHEYLKPYMIIKKIRYWDKAGSEKDKKSTGQAQTAGVKIYLIQSVFGPKFVIMDCKRGLWEAEERERLIRKTAEADGRDCLVYHEQEPGSGGKESAQATTRNLAGFVVEADRPTGDKIFRADPYSVSVNNGDVLLLRADWNQDFIEEHRHFPYSKTKDQVDSAAGCYNKLVGTPEAGVW